MGMSPLELPAASTGRAAGAAPDPDGLLRPVVEIVRLRLVDDRAAVFIADVIERCRAADHPLTRDAIDLLADRTHEVTATAGCDVVREPVLSEIVEQLDHWCIRGVEVSPAECRMGR